jgi:APA family basic amino acid/polyamine antiporter
MMAVAMLFLFAGDIGFIASLTNFTLFVTFAVINGVVLVLRIQVPNAPRPFRVPWSLGRISIPPILGIVTCGLLIVQLEATIIVLGSILTAVGAIIAVVSIPHGP